MKVLHLINGEFYSGAERVQDLLALKLPMYGWQADFVCLKPGRFGRCREARSARLYAVPMRSRFDLRAAWTLARLLREGDYQLLHTHTPRTAMIGSIAAALAHRPLVHHLHSPTTRDTESPWRNAANHAVEHVSLARAQRLIAVSDSLRGYIEKAGTADKRIRVVPNGVPVCPAPLDWHAPSGRWMLGTVALFRPRKGIEVLLEAMRLLRQRGYDVGLRAVGAFERDSYREEIMQLAVQLGVADAIEWRGFTRDIGGELQKMHIFVLPSRFGEGLPMALIEAMAIGLPVVASAVEGTAEVLQPAGAGVLVEASNAASLATGIASLIKGGEDTRAIAMAGRRRQIERYSDQAMACAVAGIYAELMAVPGQSRNALGV